MIEFETHPGRYRHWQLAIDGAVATLNLDVQEEGALVPGYKLKLNSYDLGVDIELADAIERLRFEHPEVGCLVLGSARPRIFSAGANIFMLGQSSHAFKVNFCKFTNETRLALEDASQFSGLKSLAAVSGPCAGGGYELALACDEIFLIDDGHSTVSLPEVPLLGVLPGTGGLTRLIDKRQVRRDRADFFCTVADGIKGQRAVEWRLADAVFPTSRFGEAVAQRAAELADLPRPAPRGVTLNPVAVQREGEGLRYPFVSLELARERRIATLTLMGPGEPPPADPDHIAADFWPLQAFRELDRALLHLRFNEPEMGTILLQTRGEPQSVLAYDRFLLDHQHHWLVRETILLIKRVLKRLDLTARSLIATIAPGSCFVGSLLELALAADRTYMLDDPAQACWIQLSGMNAGPLPMGNGLTRLKARFLGEPETVADLLQEFQPLDPAQALEMGLVTFAPDDIDWEEEVRLALEERASLSPDALTGLEASLRCVGPETMETRIFGRLSAWQNWIFQRPNATGEKGALKVYGRSGLRPEFNWERT